VKLPAGAGKSYSAIQKTGCTLLRCWLSLGLWSAAQSGAAQVSLRALLGIRARRGLCGVA
jgi:hypothetical protein